MKYIANPVVVDAHKIISIANPVSGKEEGYFMALDNGEAVTATPEMCSRMTPKIGDYWVIQSDGYVYLNPREVFERKYSLVPQDEVIRPGNPYFGHILPADRPVVPGLEGFETVYGKDQPQYIPLRTLVSSESLDQRHEAISRWTPTPEQRLGIAAGADIFLSLLTFGRPLPPIRMMVADNPNADWFKEYLQLRPEPPIPCTSASSAKANPEHDDRLPQPDRRHGASVVPPDPPPERRPETSKE